MDEPWKQVKTSKAVSHKGPHIIWFHWYKMLCIDKSTETEKTGCTGLEVLGEMEEC